MMNEWQLKHVLQAVIEAVVNKMNSTGEAYRKFDRDLDGAVAQLLKFLADNK